MNATPDTGDPGLGVAEGIETYILNNTTDATSRRLAKLENTVLVLPLPAPRVPWTWR